MPGKYLEFVKSGRYVVPVEITFLPTTYKENGEDKITSKWAIRSHWKEIKALLKPAVDSCLSTTTDGFSTSPHVSYGQEVGLGYVLGMDSNKDKSPFFAVLDPKRNCWTDDEDDDQLNELYAGLRDYGGSHRSHQPTKIYVKAAVIKRTSSTTNDSKKLKKELGFKGEDLRSYFQSTKDTSSSSNLTASLHDKAWIDGRRRRFGFGTLGRGEMNEIGPFIPAFPRRLATEPPPVASRNSATYYEEQDDEEESDDDYLEVDLHKGHGRRRRRTAENDGDVTDDDNDDNFSLPDIDAPQADIQLKQLQNELANKEKQLQREELDSGIDSQALNNVTLATKRSEGTEVSRKASHSPLTDLAGSGSLSEEWKSRLTLESQRKKSKTINHHGKKRVRKSHSSGSGRENREHKSTKKRRKPLTLKIGEFESAQTAPAQVQDKGLEDSISDSEGSKSLNFDSILESMRCAAAAVLKEKAPAKKFRKSRNMSNPIATRNGTSPEKIPDNSGSVPVPPGEGTDNGRIGKIVRSDRLPLEKRKNKERSPEKRVRLKQKMPRKHISESRICKHELAPIPNISSRILAQVFDPLGIEVVGLEFDPEMPILSPPRTLEDEFDVIQHDLPILTPQVSKKYRRDHQNHKISHKRYLPKKLRFKTLAEKSTSTRPPPEAESPVPVVSAANQGEKITEMLDRPASGTVLERSVNGAPARHRVPTLEPDENGDRDHVAALGRNGNGARGRVPALERDGNGVRDRVPTLGRDGNGVPDSVPVFGRDGNSAPARDRVPTFEPDGNAARNRVPSSERDGNAARDHVPIFGRNGSGARDPATSLNKGRNSILHHREPETLIEWSRKNGNNQGTISERLKSVLDFGNVERSRINRDNQGAESDRLKSVPDYGIVERSRNNRDNRERESDRPISVFDYGNVERSRNNRDNQGGESDRPISLFDHGTMERNRNGEIPGPVPLRNRNGSNDHGNTSGIRSTADRGSVPEWLRNSASTGADRGTVPEWIRNCENFGTAKTVPRPVKIAEILAPIEMDDHEKLVENFIEEDESAGIQGNNHSNSLASQSELGLMMPPPTRPAPRTPRKNDASTSASSRSTDLTRSDTSRLFDFLRPLSHSRGNSLPSAQSSSGSLELPDPSKLSTIQIMSNPGILRAGVGLLNTLTAKKSKQMTMTLGQVQRRERALSPDITMLPQISSLDRERERDQEDAHNEGRGALESTRSRQHDPENGQGQHSDEELSDPDQDRTEEGENLIRELLNRVDDNHDTYEPEGDGYDLSQKSLCYLNIIPEYSRKSRSFKMHCKKITDLTFEKLEEHYTGIRPSLRQIFEGELVNARSLTYLTGPGGIKRLQEMSVSIPFDHDQTGSIITMILSYFFPDVTTRPKWSDYVSYVLLPEALINIYARVNEISYEMAEKEMRFQGCYDDVSQ